MASSPPTAQVHYAACIGHLQMWLPNKWVVVGPDGAEESPIGGTECQSCDTLLTNSTTSAPGQTDSSSSTLCEYEGRFQFEMRRRIPAMLNLRALRVRNALARECMAEFLGTFVLLVSESICIYLQKFLEYLEYLLISFQKRWFFLFHNFLILPCYFSKDFSFRMFQLSFSFWGYIGTF